MGTPATQQSAGSQNCTLRCCEQSEGTRRGVFSALAVALLLFEREIRSNDSLERGNRVNGIREAHRHVKKVSRVARPRRISRASPRGLMSSLHVSLSGPRKAERAFCSFLVLGS